LLRPRGLVWSSLKSRLSWKVVKGSIAASGRVPPDHPFLLLARLRRGRLVAPAASCDAYIAAALADALREDALASGQSFAFETVMSHPSKVEFLERARAAGHRTYLYYIATERPELNEGRIETRVGLGGHDVPSAKTHERYYRSLGLLRRALAASDRAYLFDNSGEEPVWVAEQGAGELSLMLPPPRVPGWVKRYAL
jgi:predicted ABC-type ATPase